MALAIAIGVQPQYGLYTAIVSGFWIAFLGGSRLSVSGPTAAFIVILQPVVASHGLSGLMLATIMSGMILVVMAVAKLGRVIEYIPEPVTLGFTAGIAVVIATLQLKDFLGLPLAELNGHYHQKVLTLLSEVQHIDLATSLVGSSTLAILLLWPRLKLNFSGYLPAIMVGALIAWLMGQAGFVVDTIGSEFQWQLADGRSGSGIPPELPSFQRPWAQGQSDPWTFDKLIALIPDAFSIAMLGAIESLLCAVVLDGMTGKRHHSNGELMGQGVGNIITPLFGGFTATAALARSATNYKSGGKSPIAAMVHAMVVLLSIALFADALGYVPMASLAALLLVVAWNMSEAHKVTALIKKAPAGDILVLLSCFLLTVFVDMVVAIGVGVVLASLLFMRQMASLTTLKAQPSSAANVMHHRHYQITGPLFFAAADRIFTELTPTLSADSAITLDLTHVPLIDAGGLASLERFRNHCQSQHIELDCIGANDSVNRALTRAGLHDLLNAAVPASNHSIAQSHD